ncbi:Non-specific lipid-transfer protein 1 [Sesamum angolense]|uniref:Non-specific lipid-transfer protein n=1 Tax=Sesamum angolense TaxID=2727404 RepID=A0AAE2C6S1_9LAMI|nr:Non-specific lipid-transfer protein 1 [Sesamum angolense]
MKGGIVAVFAVFAIVLFIVQPGQAVTCGQVDAALVPCISYLTGHGDSPSPACCAGVKAVKGMAQTTADKRASCACVKAAANRYANLKDDAAQSLPTKCNVQMDIPDQLREEEAEAAELDYNATSMLLNKVQEEFGRKNKGFKNLMLTSEHLSCPNFVDNFDAVGLPIFKSSNLVCWDAMNPKNGKLPNHLTL